MTTPNHCSVTVVMRELASTYHVLNAYDARHLREFGMTPSQADVVCQLGRDRVMSQGELATITLVSRGSLSGVLERLEARGLIQRKPSRQDRRRMLVRLTDAGEDIYDKLLPARVSRMAERFDRLDEQTRGSILDALRELRHIFIQPGTSRPAAK